MGDPKVSIVIPCYNTAKYLRQCMDSVVNQTLRELEIICVNDGSTDETLSILEEYARRDDRITILDKPNGGYGESMNRGFAMATGEYLGIIEPDDFAERDMFETLYRCASENDLDVVKASHYRYVSSPEPHDEAVRPLTRFSGKRVFWPLRDIRRHEDKVMVFRFPDIWAGLYRRAFIQKNQIRFLETPGASYQDTGFNFKVWVKARRAMLLENCVLHYRVDNAASSVHNPGKLYCVCDEYAEMFRFLDRNPEEREAALPVLIRMKYESYLWNYNRLSPELQGEFIFRFAEEFRQHKAEGQANRSAFTWYAWNKLERILLDPERFHQLDIASDRGEDVPDFYDAYPDQRPIRWKPLYYIAENIAGGLQTVRESGWRYTIGYVFQKLGRKLSKNNISSNN